MAVYVYGALGSTGDSTSSPAAFLVAGILAGLVGGLGVTGTLTRISRARRACCPRR